MNTTTRSYVSPAPLPGRDDPGRAAIDAAWLADETDTLNQLLAMAEAGETESAAIVARAADWVRGVRRLKDRQSMLDAFMHEYDLSSEEGVLLMCLAEALLRIPDDDTAEALIADKLSGADWESHLGRSDSLFVNASTWGLMLTGRIVRIAPETRRNFSDALGRLVARSGEPVIRTAVRQAMKLMGHQFVMGRSIDEAMKRAAGREQRAYRHSYDMLGEAALTAADARRYLAAYHAAIRRIGGSDGGDDGEVMHRPGISIKLSALYPRYEFAQAVDAVEALVPVLRELALAARRENIGLTVDAEEADRLDLSLDVFERVYRDRALSGWSGFGLAVQAFQKRALPVVDWLESMAREVGRRIPVRLVKGAYWDTEIKRAQEQGLPGYPVYTRKSGTDVAYLAIARRLLGARAAFYPQFATHNAHTIAAVRAFAGDESGYEFQRLHGMGEALYEVVRRDVAVPCRAYAPVGSHEDLLPYLVRRLLENGANTSFVNRIFDEDVAPEELAADPVAALRAEASLANPQIPLPAAIYGSDRLNSAGLNLADRSVSEALAGELAQVPVAPTAGSVVHESVDVPTGPEQAVLNPADRRQQVGAWVPLPPDRVAAVVGAASAAFADWVARPVDARAQVLERAADRLEAERAAFLALLVREAGKTLPDAIAELREAVDFLRYYAVQARRAMSAPAALPGPTGERNELQLHGRGVFVCISPWNFPLAIFAGQVAAALVTGNTVVAKPAEQTNLVAVRFTRLLIEAGLPPGVLQCVLGGGELGAALCADARVAGVAFTGSDETARAINRALAARNGPIGVLIAETGGQNAMLVDSSALPEQVVKDAVQSAFGSAGQRCSALRVLLLQNEIADRVIEMLAGAMDELRIGDPAMLSTDVGPVIDEAALSRLDAHAEAISAAGRLIRRLELPAACRHGSYFAPCAVEIDSLDRLEREQFGAMPVSYTHLTLPTKRIV